MRKVFFSLLIWGIFSINSAQAQEKSPSEWSGEAELGIVNTSGNTETETINAKAKATNERDEWKHEASVDALKAKTSDVTTAERYNAMLKTNYLLTERDYLFGVINYEDDRFSGYDWRASEFIGYGRSLIKREELTLNLEAGAGARQSRGDIEDKDEAAGRLAGALAWNISKTSKFTEDLTSEIGEDVTITKSVTGLKSQINGNLAMKITYTIKHVSEVPAGIKKTDRETAVTLVIGF